MSRLMIALTLFVFALSSHVVAVDTLEVRSPDPVMEDWRWTEFDRSSGLAGPVIAIFEDRNGDIWFATSRGAQRYDGYHWTTYTTEDGLAHNSVRAIYQTQDGAMWFGTHGGGISRFDGTTWTTYTTEDGLASNFMWTGRSLWEAQDGTLWAGFLERWQATETEGGISRFDGTTWTTVEPLEDLRRPGVVTILQASDGSLWFSTHGFGVLRFDGANWTRYTDADGLAGNDVVGPFQTRDGTLWFPCWSDGISRFDGTQWHTYTAQDGLPDGKDRGMAFLWQTLDGALWASGYGGLCRFDGDRWQVYTYPDGLKVSGLVCGSATRNGSLWIWTWNEQRIFRVDLNASRWTVFPNLPGDKVFSLGHEMWMGDMGIVVRYDGRTWTTHSPVDGMMDGIVRDIVKDRDGNVWAAGSHQGKSAVARYDGETWHIFSDADGLVGKQIYAGCAADNGDVWFGTKWGTPTGQGDGAMRYDGAAWTVFTEADGLAHNMVYDIAQTPDGAIWFATLGGVSRFDGETWTTFTPWDTENQKSVVLYVAQDGSLWVGPGHSGYDSPGGVAHYDGKTWTRYQEQDGLPCELVWGITETSDGTLWLGSYDTGLCRFDGENGSVYEPEMLPISIPRIGTNQICRSPDDALWIWTEGSKARFVPNQQAPETVLDPTPDRVSSLGNLLVRWSGRTLWDDTPLQDMRYQWRLDGKAWSPWSTRADFMFTELAIGRHVFEVRSADRDGNIDATPAVYAFIVEAPWWRNPYVLSLLILSVGLTGFMGSRLVVSNRRLRDANGAMSAANEKLFSANRNLTVEADLERVRSKALGMHKSEEIAGVAVAVFREVKELGFPIWRSSIEIKDEETKTVELWATTAEGELQPGVVYSLEDALDGLPFARDAHEAWRRGEIRHFYCLSGDELLKTVDYAVKVLKFPFHEWESQESEALPKHVDQYWLFFSHGSLWLNLLDSLSEKDLKVLQRFAEVFGFAYDRFLELQNAESQARQAEQRAAVDRVRAEIAIMRTSDDLERLTPLLWHELNNLGVPFFRCGVLIMHEDTECVDLYLANPQGSPLGVFTVPFDSHPTIRGMVDHWRDGEVYQDQWDKEIFLDWMHRVQAQGQPLEAEQYLDDQPPPEVLVLHTIPFTHGVLYVGSESTLSAEDVSLVKDLAAAFSVAYARYLDFQSLEAQNRAMSDANKELFALNRALERERAVEHLREQVQMMEAASDFENVLSLLAEDLKAAGLAFETCGIEVLDEPVDDPSMDYFQEHGFRYTAYTIDPDGEVTRNSYHIPAPFPPVNLEPIERFIEGQSWQGRSEQTSIVEVPTAAYGRLRLTASDRQMFTGEEIETLREFATAVALGYTRFLDLKAVMAALEIELQVAHDMQMDLLPESPPKLAGFSLSGTCIPANHVGGDYYQYVYLDEAKTKLGIVLADVSGHEMQAATVAMRFNEVLRYEAKGRTDVVEILTGLHESLEGQIPEMMFVTCGIAVLDTEDQSMRFASAANPEVYHYIGEQGEVRGLSITGLPLGMRLPGLGDPVRFNSTEMALAPGDVIVFASDGVEEAFNAEEDLYGRERLAALLAALGQRNLSAEAIRDGIVEDVKGFMGDADQKDDITVVVLKRETN